MPYQRPDKPGLKVEEFRAGVAKLPTQHAKMAWDLVLTGMNWKEYRHDGWDSEPAAGVVHVHGEKRLGRERDIPYLAPLSGPTRDYRRFRLVMHKAFGPTVTPHTLRRTFAQWAEAAGVSRFRVEVYLGHTFRHAKVTDLYRDEIITPEILVADAKLMRAHIGRPLGAVSLTLEARSA